MLAHQLGQPVLACGKACAELGHCGSCRRCPRQLAYLERLAVEGRLFRWVRRCYLESDIDVKGEERPLFLLLT